MKKWIQDLMKQYKASPGTHGQLIIFNRLYEKKTEIKLKINELTGFIQIRDVSDLELKREENVVFLEHSQKNKEEVLSLYRDLSILTAAEKELIELAGKTNVNPKTIAQLKIIHGTIFSTEAAARELILKLKNQINAALGKINTDQSKPVPLRPKEPVD